MKGLRRGLIVGGAIVMVVAFAMFFVKIVLGTGAIPLSTKTAPVSADLEGFLAVCVYLSFPVGLIGLVLFAAGQSLSKTPPGGV